ncbi:MAG: alanine acetyltransferase, partial [Limnochordia bacterium]
MAYQVCLETARLWLRTLDESFAPQVLEFFRRNREHLEPWEPPRPNSFYEQLEHHRRQLAFDLV